jgi:hypothetical protein
VTDLKAANQMLAQAIQALESAEHDADVSEAEAIRNRLLDLDAAIGDRIQAKLDAHRLIVDSWGVSEAIIPRRLDMANEPIVEITDPLAAFDADSVVTADAWDKHHETFHITGLTVNTTVYAQSGDEITEPVFEMSVAEIQQDNNSPN